MVLGELGAAATNDDDDGGDGDGDRNDAGVYWYDVAKTCPPVS